MQEKTIKNITEIFLTFMFWLFIGVIIFVVQFVHILWFAGSSGPYLGIKYTEPIQINPKYTKKIAFNKKLNIYYINEYPVLCVQGKSKNSCILLEEMKNKKLFNIRVSYVFFTTRIIADTKNITPIDYVKHYFYQKVFYVDYYNDGTFSYYFYPKTTNQ